MLNGVLIINKLSGYSSFSIIKCIKKIFKNTKVGHTGTLDPMASGLLIILLGKKTKKCKIFNNYKKKYFTKIKINSQSITCDSFGKSFYKNKRIIKKNNLKKIIKNIINKRKQIPHKFSAIKIKGKKSYKLIRNNKKYFIKEKKIKIEKIKLIFKNKFYYLLIESYCSIYVRSIVRDISIIMKIPMTIVELKRIKIGNYSIKKSIPQLLLKKKKIIKKLIIKND